MPPQTLNLRELNRTHLHRQHLLARSQMGTRDMLSAIVGLQAQEVKDPYLALWSRLESFTHDALGQMLLDRTAVRASLMRGTIHLVSEADYLLLFPTMYTHHLRAVHTVSNARLVPSEYHPEIIAKAKTLLLNTPLTAAQLGDILHTDWPDFDPRSLSQVVRFLLPLIQTPPRGVWGTEINTRPSWTLAEQWLGVPVSCQQGPAHEMIRRYLRAFGPASLADLTSWAGVTNLKQPLNEMADELQTYHDESGAVLYDLVGLTISPVDTPAPVRFLPGFDNALLGHKNRRRIISDQARALISTPNGMFSATFLVDGYVAGAWRIKDEVLELSGFDALTRSQQADVEAEASHVAPFWVGAELPIRWADLWKLPGKHPR